MKEKVMEIQTSFLKTVYIIGFIGILLVLLNNIRNSEPAYRVTIDIIAILVLLVCTILINRQIEYKTAKVVLLTCFIVSAWITAINLEYQATERYYILTFPLISYFLNGRKSGTKWIVILLFEELLIVFLSRFNFVYTVGSHYEFTKGFIYLLILSIFCYYFCFRHETIVKQLFERAFKDELTNLPNRNKFLEEITENHKVVGIISMDDLKVINTVYGYSFGDTTIKELSIQLLNIAGLIDMKLYRLSGSEFAITGDSFSCTEEELEKLANKIIYEIEMFSFIRDDTKIRPNLTIGLAYNDSSSELLLYNADKALKKAKLQHTLYHLVYNNNEPAEEFKEYLQISDLIHKSLENDNIFPYYQPIVSNETGEILKYEALIRISDDMGNIYTPITFLEYSKRIKAYSKLTLVMLKKIESALIMTNHNFSINISYEDISDTVTSKLILQFVKKNKIHAHRLTFEILESESIKSMELLKEFLSNISSFNCKIAIDDFGTGYANFDYLIHYRFDYLKIDGSLIKNIHIDNNSQDLVKNIINFAKMNNIKTIAEFVHCEEVYEMIKTLGIDYSQGYYFGKPGLLNNSVQCL